MTSTPAKNVFFTELVFVGQRKNMVAENYPVLQTLYPQFIKKPSKLPNPKFIWAVLVMLAIMLLFFSKVKAEEPAWDKLIPIIIKIESNGNPNAISEDGCIGLMQISPCVLKEYLNYLQLTCAFNPPCKYCSSVNLYNAEVNKFIGTWYLKQIWFHYLPHYKLEEIKEKPLLLLVACYNWGIGNVVKWYKKGAKYDQLPRETKRYYEKFYKMYRVQK